MIMIHYRLLQEQDCKLVLELMGRHPLQFPGFVQRLYPERWNLYLKHKDDAKYWVAVRDTEDVVGHAGYIWNSDLKRYEIVGVVVSPLYQRQGIGAGILDAVCAGIRDRGHFTAVLFTLGHPGNEGTLNFYKRLGYQQTRYELNYFAEGYSRVGFERTLLST
ncbi:GNAT superfamily N-acetyltransferase [Paenibacillus sp. LBL]|uniref:GNAT family N-acetyltransferase n=1 Tax=Paenibacillus TaxID=44249 RepID=UPI0009EE2A18|nr:GNAT family N-acetyltransferase [Paenibacillus sp. LBL]MDH6670745.1 GNAT superfamily N-acetyltransferase [Paenibacillus sp. LBL]